MVLVTVHAHDSWHQLEIDHENEDAHENALTDRYCP